MLQREYLLKRKKQNHLKTLSSLILSVVPDSATLWVILFPFHVNRFLKEIKIPEYVSHHCFLMKIFLLMLISNIFIVISHTQYKSDRKKHWFPSMEMPGFWSLQEYATELFSMLKTLCTYTAFSLIINLCRLSL